MFTLDLKIDFETRKALDTLGAIAPEKWPTILRDATNETAFYVLNKFKKEMPNYIDRPTPFTLNSMFVRKATADRLDASVQWKDWTGSGSIPAGKYLTPEVYGGARKQKRFEKALQAAGLMPAGYVAVPTKDAPVDSYGNVPGGYITQILSYVRANPDYLQNRRVKQLRRMGKGKLIAQIVKTASNRDAAQEKEAKARARKQKFFVVIQGRDNNPLPSGIYERVNMSLGSAIKRVFSFIPAATYRVSFPFYDIGTAAATDKFPSKVYEAIAKAIGPTLKAGG